MCWPNLKKVRRFKNWKHTQTLLIILEKGSSCATSEFPFQRTFPLQLGTCGDEECLAMTSRTGSSDRRFFAVDVMAELSVMIWQTRLELLVIGWGWNGVWWGQEKKRWTWAWGHKKFLETQTITLQLQLFRELCALQKKAEGFLCPLSGQLAYVYIWQSIGIKTLFSVFLAGSKPMEVQQLPLDEIKNK